MNKRLIFLFMPCLWCLVYTAHAQSSGPVFGLKSGLTFTRITYAPEPEEESVLTGFTGGLFIRQPMSEPFSLNAELLYSERGSRSEWKIINEVADKTIRLSYLDLAVTGRFLLGESGYFETGPYVGYLLHTMMQVNPVEAGLDAQLLGKDDFRTLDFGWVAGFGLRFNTLDLGIRYQYGLQNTAASPEGATLLDKGKNRSIQMLIGYTLRR